MSKTEEYRMGLNLIVNAARMIEMVDVPGMLSAIATADSIGPLVVTSLWVQRHKAMEEDKEIFEAALPLWKLAQKLKKMAEEGTASKKESGCAPEEGS